jgi:hypothetical protein
VNAFWRRTGRRPVKNATKKSPKGTKYLLLATVALSYQMVAASAWALDKGQLYATEENGYARLILSFPNLDALPAYSMKIDNGVLSIQFEEQVDLVLPDVGTTMPNYLSVARLDPDRRGLRVGLKNTFNFNRIEAGEKLFVDLMPSNWQGMPPALPQEIVDELAERARQAAIKAEQQRKARMAAELNPTAKVRIGTAATFTRLQFDWSVPTDAEFVQNGELGEINFEWPVEIDVSQIIDQLPEQLASLDTAYSVDGSVASLRFAEGVEPRFYAISSSQYVLDIDTDGIALPALTPAALEGEVANTAAEAEATRPPEPSIAALQATPAETITPYVNVLGNTVRVVFPFESDIPAAVFRRGDSVWMIFDTVAGIGTPAYSSDLDAVTSDFAVLTSGDTQIVRLDLSQERLATIGSEGMAWVLSLGDMMLSPTEPMALTRRRDDVGSFEMVADIARPGRIHQFQDPVVGDTLSVVTAYPPARGLTRTLDYVDFTALRSVHGLVVKPKSPSLEIALESNFAVLTETTGLTVSALDTLRNIGTASDVMDRSGFIDLGTLEQKDPFIFTEQRDRLEMAAALTQGSEREIARLNLAQYYIANQFAQEALGVIRLLEEEPAEASLTREIRTTSAVASILADRPIEALKILNSPSLDQDVDAKFWRTIARANAGDFRGARADALDAHIVQQNYPEWARLEFQLATARAAVEAEDPALADTVLEDLNFALLAKEMASDYLIATAQLAELKNRPEEALDIYGQVIASEVRPSRAEAVYRTLLLLDKQGRLDLAKATETLSAEIMLWRGDRLEADMQGLLANLYFRNGDYRLGFEAVRNAISHYTESPTLNALRDEAQEIFSDLYLNGVADSIGPIEALSIYYDFQHLTPPGVRGDEMIRNLARRLVRVDLLPQAAELLQYQLDHRLRGAARAQLGTDLAVIYLADRRPQDAMRVLNDTRLPDLPDGLQRQRRILEARAMIDAGRDVLALDLVRMLSGKDVELLRIDAHWKAKRYSQAGEMIEAIYGNRPAGTPLDATARMALVKAGVGYVLANDRYGASRLRSKFSDEMVGAPEWAMFDYVTGPIQATSMEFKKVAAEIAAIDSLTAFLASYRETYGGQGALTPVSATKTGSGTASL